MKTKALLLSALILAPSAGAAAVQAAPTQEFRVQINKAMATPAQDFRVSYTGAALTSTPAIFAKSSLPQALSDEELDEVTGEAVPLLAPAVGGAALNVAIYAGGQKLQNEPITAGGVAKAAAIGAVTGTAGAVRSAAVTVATQASKIANSVTNFALNVAGGLAGTGGN